MPQTVKYINLLSKKIAKMRDYEIRIFLQLQPTQKWAVWCVMDYFRYQQTVFTIVFISKAPFDGENSKFLRDLNIIVKLNFYTESTVELSKIPRHKKQLFASLIPLLFF